jgi:hypothetical protein
MPFAAGETSGYQELKDSILRAPLKSMKRRPFFAKPGEEVRMK